MRYLIAGLLIALLVIPAAAGPGAPTYHFLRVDGAAFSIEVFLNGHSLFRDEIPHLPIYVSGYLKDGRNELTVTYASEKDHGLTVAVEERATGSRKTEIVRFTSKPDETHGRETTQKLSFTAHVPPQGVLHLTDADRKQMLVLIQMYYDTLVHRDAEGLRRFYEKALQEAADIYPEGTKSFRETFDWSLRVLTRPGFQMQPFQQAGLRFTVEGQTVRVSRMSDAPLMESRPVEIDGARTTLAEVTLTFKKYDGRWHVALPFGF